MEDAVPETQYEYVDAGDGDADVADDAALEAEYVTAEPVEAEHRVVEIEADAFSVYSICYTVDYEFNGFVWRMNGGSSIWLSRLLALLNADFGVEDVREATFSDPALLAVTYDAEERDWYLSSLAPFTSEETLTLTLLDGETVEIRVTDTQEPRDIEEFLTEAEFLLDGVHVGGSSDPDPMEVRTAHIYRLRLVFQEEEEGRQFPDSGGMIYELPEGIDWRLLDGTVTTFDISRSSILWRDIRLHTVSIEQRTRRRSLPLPMKWTAVFPYPSQRRRPLTARMSSSTTARSRSMLRRTQPRKSQSEIHILRERTPRRAGGHAEN